MDPPHADVLDAGVDQVQRARRRLVQADDKIDRAHKRMVEAGFGLALLQAGAVEEELSKRELAIIRVDDLNVTIPVVRIIRHGGHLSGGAQALLKALERLKPRAARASR